VSFPRADRGPSGGQRVRFWNVTSKVPVAHVDEGVHGGIARAAASIVVSGRALCPDSSLRGSGSSGCAAGWWRRHS